MLEVRTNRYFSVVLWLSAIKEATNWQQNKQLPWQQTTWQYNLRFSHKNILTCTYLLLLLTTLCCVMGKLERCRQRKQWSHQFKTDKNNCTPTTHKPFFFLNMDMPCSLSLMRGRPVSEDDNSDAHIGAVLSPTEAWIKQGPNRSNVRAVKCLYTCFHWALMSNTEQRKCPSLFSFSCHTSSCWMQRLMMQRLVHVRLHIQVGQNKCDDRSSSFGLWWGLMTNLRPHPTNHRQMKTAAFSCSSGYCC